MILVAKKKEGHRVEEPPYTPFIDIIFQILIFFMLSMHFNKDEGQLRSYLPKDRGLISVSNVPKPPELRIYMCCDSSGKSMTMHISHKMCGVSDCKNCHEKVASHGGETFAALGMDSTPLVKEPTFLLKKDASFLSVCSQIAARVVAQLDTGLYRNHKKGTKGTVSIDACGPVPVEHFVAMLDALQRSGITRDAEIQFAGDPAFAELLSR